MKKVANLLEAYRAAGQRNKVGAVPEFLAKARRDGFIDPRSDDFAKNQAFGRGLGAAMFPAVVGSGLTVGGMVGGYTPARNVGLASLLLAAGKGGVAYSRNLKKFRGLQAEGRNPATGKMYDLARIERTQRLASANRKGGGSVQKELNQQVLDHGGG